MMSRTNSQFVAASLTEFLSVWSMNGEANLNLATKGGNLDIQFSLSLGNPGAPFSPSPPAPPPYKARHRGPAQKERNRARAARHQAAKTAELSVSSIDPATASVTDPETTTISSVTAETTAAVSVTAASTTSTVSVALAENPTNCELCDFQGVSTVGLKIHKSRKHEDIPQIDGADSNQRETDSWWEEHNKLSLRSYQMYIAVLKDIEDAKISEEEKLIEKENVTNVRKEALGKIFDQCPPWSG